VRARKSVGLSQERLAEVLRVDRSTVTRWECAETEPQPWLRPKLARALGLRLHQLDEMLSVIEGIEEPADDGRLSSVLTGRTRVDLAAIHQLQDQVRQLGEAYETMPSASLLARAGQTHAVLTLLLAEAYDDRGVQALHTALAASASLMSQLIWDASGRRDGASTLDYCDQAIVAANETGDAVMAAHAELRKCYVALYGLHGARNPSLGQALAESAATIGKSTSHALTGLALLHVAEALAMQGEYRQTEQALSQAEHHFSHTMADDVGAEFFSPSQFGRLSGSCYLFLNSPERAQVILEETAALLPDRPKTRSLVLGNLALSFIRQRQIDAATGTLMDAIDLIEDTRGGAGMSVVFSAGRELYPWRAEPAVQEINDRLLALMAKN
jgi:transcriptional regulator with XRE-family HTH domain